MKAGLLNIYLVGIMWAFSTGCSTIDPASTQPASVPAVAIDPYNSLSEHLEKLRRDHKIPGMAAAVAQDDKILWSGGFGFANIEKMIPVTPDTVFHLASLTKPFAATVIMQLVEEGKLSLDLSMRDIIPQLSETNGVIRVRHILNHTSEGTPGSKYKYNGARFHFIDAVIGKTTGHPAARVLYERILAPLKLTNTAPNPEDVANCRLAERDPVLFKFRLAQGYHSDGKRPIPYPARFTSSAGMVSTVGDIARFSMALDQDLLLSPATREMMFTPATSINGITLPYANGWFVFIKDGIKYVWHYGWWDGNSSLIVKIPQTRQTFVLMANSDMLSRPFNLGGDSNLFRSAFATAFIETIIRP